MLAHHSHRSKFSNSLFACTTVIASASEAIHGHVGKESGLLRRFAPVRKRFAFVAGNDEWIHLRIPAARMAPELCMNPSPRDEAWGMPGAQCTRSLVCAW
jgi:hypothetical protein